MSEHLNGLFLSGCSSLDWPEVKKEKLFSGIYYGNCNICKSQFAGYKRRGMCYPCYQLNHNTLDNEE